MLLFVSDFKAPAATVYVCWYSNTNSALTGPAGAAEQQHWSLCPQCHCVISGVTNWEDRPLHLKLLSPGKHNRLLSAARIHFFHCLLHSLHSPTVLKQRIGPGQSHEELMSQLEWSFSEDGGWPVIQSCCSAKSTTIQAPQISVFILCFYSYILLLCQQCKAWEYFG